MSEAVELAADCVDWAASPEAKFLKGKFVWPNWDAEEITGGNLLEIGLSGWPFQ
jgi:hypothetical protein